MTGYAWDVRVDGTNIAGIVTAGGSITTGRNDPFDAPTLPTAVVDVLTRDRHPWVVDAWPEFGLGDHSAASGFVDTYADTYTGALSRLTLAAPVTITARTPSGFTDTYTDPYAGEDLTRITGTVQAIDYTPDAVRLTITHPAEAWARLLVGATGEGVTIPQEADTARVTRYAAEAGVSVTITGADGPDLIPVPENTTASPLWDLLAAIAADTGGLLIAHRDGTVEYVTPAGVAATRDPDTPAVLDTAAIPFDPVGLSADLSLVRTRVTVTYGTGDPRPTVTATDETLRVALGGGNPDTPHRDYTRDVMLADETDAQAVADALLAAFAPSWDMPSLVFRSDLADDAATADVARILEGEYVTADDMPAGAPVTSITAPVIGVTDTLDGAEWAMTLHLSTIGTPAPLGGP